MGYAIYGTPVFKEVNNYNIELFLKLKFGTWLFQLNFDNYTNFVYNLDLKRYCKDEIDKLHNLGKNDIINRGKQKNEFILQELKTLKGLIRIIDGFFKFNEIDEYAYLPLKNQFETDDRIRNNQSTIRYIQEHYNKNDVPVLQQSRIASDCIDLQNNSNLEHLKYTHLYLLTLLYFDYIKIEEFLESKIDYSIEEYEPKRIVNESVKSDNFYCQIGALFAQGFITKKKNGFNFDYKFKNRSFSDVSKLSKYIKEDILKTDKAVRQYINDTLKGAGEKDFYSSKTKMTNIVEYCKENNIKTTNDFQNKYIELKNVH